MTNSKEPSRDISDQDEVWLAFLAGRDGDSSDSPTAKEAKILRSVILEDNEDELKNISESEDELRVARNLKKLHQRLKQEGLLNEAKTQTKPHWFYKAAPMAIAAVLVLSIGIKQMMRIPTISPGFQEPYIVRGEMEKQVIVVKDSRHSQKVAKQLIKQLAALDIPYRYTTLGEDNEYAWQIEINLPYAPSQAILTFLAQWKLTETEDGWIKIVPEVL